MARRKRASVRIGISGWRYAPWRGVFYPARWPQARELEFASAQFPTIEVNGSFYSLLRPSTYSRWYEATPSGFVFALKGGRYVSHFLRLKNAESGLANFFASGALCLREKLGPILWQLPPQLKFEPELLESFFELLPKTTLEAAELAARHSPRLAGRAATRALHEGPLRYALEVRHESFLDRGYISLLRRYGVASCVADSAGLYPLFDDVTAEFVYVRLHGSKQLYTSGYTPAELAVWAGKVRAWASGADAPDAVLVDRPSTRRTPRDVYVYFDNDVKVRAPFDALNLARAVDGRPLPPVPKSVRSVREAPRTSWSAWAAR